MIKPVGHYVLIKVIGPEETSEGGIVIAKQTLDKEKRGTELGIIEAIGPTAFKEWPGCFSPRALELARKSCNGHVDDATYEHFKWHDPDYPPHRVYGVEIGDKVEFRRYEGKIASTDEDIRFIPDSHIMGVIRDE